jgi:hypothetical protein
VETIRNPTPRRGERNIFCPFYSGCLDTAIIKQWPYWTCVHCEHRVNQAAEPEIPLYVSHGIAYYNLETKD